jgi:hypothetical protein
MSNKIKPELQLYPRKIDPKTVNDERYDENSYVSIQSKVNNDPNFEKKYINKIIEDGWVALRNITDIFLYPKGRSFKYRLNGESLSGAPEGTFRSGGWLIGKNEDDPDNNDKYILYKGYNGVIFPLQIKDILEIYIKSPARERGVFKRPLQVTNYPVYLYNNQSGKNEIVYYGKDNSQRHRFMNTIKYKKAYATGNWSWSIVFEH